jgi:siroheme synthase (precorrin-2 oxidase/ferrochelatase)
MDTKNIAIIGAGSIGKTVALELAKNGNNVCVLSDVVGSQFTDLREPEPFLITKLPDMPEPWIDPKEPIFNYKKHKQTCDKKRKARKKKKRR